MIKKELCYYCEANLTSRGKYGLPCCQKCNIEFWSYNEFHKNEKLDNRSLTKRHKVLLKTFGNILK